MTKHAASALAAVAFAAWCGLAALKATPATSATSTAPAASAQSPAESGARYVGSATCQPCHKDTYAGWSKTRMANVVVDPKTHPDAIIPDLSKPDPLVTFKKEDIAFVYGGKWKQRYFTKVGDDYFPLGAQWDTTHKVWRRYFVADGTDWWVPHYPADNMKRPTGPTCDGCHSVNYNVTTKSVTEWNVGCEKCHGPGSLHVAQPSGYNIINPSKVSAVQANDTCIQCHSQGQPLRNPIEGRYYDWPVGFDVGKNLSSFWKLDPPELGTTTFLHFADGTAHKNRMQGNDFVTSRMYLRGVRCADCHDVHGSDNDALLRRPVKDICARCHWPGGQNGPLAPTLERHTHHKAESAGSECVACHMPKIAQTIGDVNVRSHTFRFIPPSATDRLKIPNACTTCHANQSTLWAATTLKTWTEFSPWRVP